MKKPKPIVVGPLHAYAKKPPTKRCPNWYWQVVTHVEGKRHQVDRGRFDRRTLQQRMAARVAAGVLEPAAVRTINTVGELLRGWLLAQRDRGDLKDSSFNDYKRRIKRLLQGGAASVPLAKCDTAALRRIQAGLLERYNGETPKNAWVVLSMAWKWGQEMGVVTLPMPGVRWPRTARVYNHYTPSEEDVAAVLVAAGDGWVGDALRGVFLTGYRIGELAALRACDLAPSRGEVHLLRKGARARDWIPANPQAMELFVRLRGDKVGDTRLWPVAASTMKGKGWSHLQRLCDRAGVPRFAWHGVRRLASTRALEHGMPARVYETIFGHSMAMGLRRYAEARGTQEAIRVLEANLPKVGEEPPEQDNVITVDFGRRPQ